MHQLKGLVRKHAAAAWEYRWYAILFSWLVCAAGWVAVLRVPNVYESSARLYVDADAVLTPLLRGLAVESSLQSQVDLLQRTLLSRPNLERLISKTDLELEIRSPSDRQAMAERLATEIRINPQTRNLFLFTYRNESPKLAFDVVQSMLTLFVESKAGNNRSDLENASRFLETQLGMYERQLRETERRRAEFRAKYLDVLPGDGGVSRLETAVQQVRSLQGDLLDAQGRRAALAKELAATQPLLLVENSTTSGAGGFAAVSRTSRLQEAESKLMELRLHLTDQHPDVIAQRGLIAALRSGQLGPEPGAIGGPLRGPHPASAGDSARGKSVSNPVYEQLKVRLVETDSNISSLERQLRDATEERDRLQAIVRGAPGLQAEAINLNRDYDIVRRNYEELLARRESMRISTAAEANADKVKIQIIDPPLVPAAPVAPKRLLMISGVLFAGLGAGAALAVLLAQLDQSFRTTDDLRDLGYPVVGGVSLINASISAGRRLFTVGSFAVAVAVPCLIYGGLMLRLMRSGAI